MLNFIKIKMKINRKVVWKLKQFYIFLLIFC